MAPKKRLEVWRKLGIIPGGPNSEAATLLSKTMTNVNNDVVDLLLHALRLGIANEYAGLFGITTLQEILMGTASITEGEVNIGVLDPETVNIMAHGHQPLLAIKVLEVAGNPELVEEARGDILLINSETARARLSTSDICRPSFPKNYTLRLFEYFGLT